MLKMPEGAIGKELVLDLFDCNTDRMTKEYLDTFFILLCDEIGMTRTELFYWEYLEDEDKDPEEFYHLKGLSGVQFIKTSSIVFHGFDNERKINLNLFSCKDFDEHHAQEFIKNYFEAQVRNSTTLVRW